MNQRVAIALFVVAALVAVGAALYFGGRPTTVVEEQAMEMKPVVRESNSTPTAAQAPPKRERGTRRGAAVVVGSVRAYGTDKPVDGATITLSSGDIELSTKSGADGSFAVAHVPAADAWTLRVDASAGQTQLAGIVAPERRTTDVGVVYLAPGFATLGVVEDEQGVGIAGASVVVVMPRSQESRFDFMSVIRDVAAPVPAAQSTTSDAAGRFTVTGLPPGAYTFVARKPGFGAGMQPSVTISPNAQAQTVRIVLAKGWPVDGRVVRSGEGSVAGLAVVAVPSDGMEVLRDMRLPTKCIATTDEHGAFAFDGIAEGSWNFIVVPEGEAMASSEGVIVPRSAPVEVRLEGGASLSGAVTGEGGAPISGAHVYAATGKTVAHAVTSADGRYELRGLRVGLTEMFAVQAEGYCPYPEGGLFVGMMEGNHRLTLAAGRNSRDVTLAAGGKVRGTVVEEGTAVPVIGATVTVLSATTFGGASPFATSDDAGRFEISGVPTGEAVLTVSKSGWVQRDAPETSRLLMESMGRAREKSLSPDTPTADGGKGPKVVLAKNGDVVERTLEVRRSVVLKGRVVSSEGVPVPGAQVTARAEAEDDNPFLQAFSQVLGGPAPEARLADPAGQFEIAAPVAQGKVRLFATTAGSVPAKSEPIEIGGAAPPADVELRLGVGGALAGRITDSTGAGIAGAVVRWVAEDASDRSVSALFDASQRTSTDSHGEYRFGPLPPQTVVLSVRHPGHVGASTEGVNVVEGEVVRADLTLETGLTITGRALKADGTPAEVRGVMVRPVEEDERFSVEAPDTTVEADGRFRVDGLRPGEYRLTARGMGRKSEAEESETVVAKAGATDVTLRFVASTVIAGVVCLHDGKPATGVRISARSQSKQSSRVKSTTTAEDGRFRITGVAAGKYELSVGGGPARRGGAPSVNVRPTVVKDVTAGDESLVIAVEPGLAIAGRVLLPDGSPATEGDVVAQPIEVPTAADSDEEQMDDEEELAALEATVPGRGLSAPIVDGRFEITGLGPGAHSISVDVDGFPAASLHAEAGAKDVVVRLKRGGTITGRVLLPDGKPAKEAWVQIDDEEEGDEAALANMKMEETDAEGRFTLTGVPPGVHRVTSDFDDDEETYEGEVKSVSVQEDRTTDGIVIRLKKSE